MLESTSFFIVCFSLVIVSNLNICFKFCFCLDFGRAVRVSQYTQVLLHNREGIIYVLAVKNEIPLVLTTFLHCQMFEIVDSWLVQLWNALGQ